MSAGFQKWVKSQQTNMQRAHVLLHFSKPENTFQVSDRFHLSSSAARGKVLTVFFGVGSHEGPTSSFPDDSDSCNRDVAAAEGDGSTSSFPDDSPDSRVCGGASISFDGTTSSFPDDSGSFGGESVFGSPHCRRGWGRGRERQRQTLSQSCLSGSMVWHVVLSKAFKSTLRVNKYVVNIAFNLGNWLSVHFF